MKKGDTELAICLVEHSSAKRLVLSYFKDEHPRMSDERLLKQSTEFLVCFGDA